MAVTSSIKLLRTMEFAKKFNFNRSSAIGNFTEPALTSANTILQTIMGAPFSWWWNRIMIGFITTIGQQDYTLFNYTALSPVKVGWYTVDDAGNCQQCTTAGPVGASAPTWNHTINGTTADGAAVWTNIGPIGNSELSGSYSFAWIETASVQEINNYGTRWVEMFTRQLLPLEDKQARPNFVSGQLTDANGNITFRISPVPDKAYPVVLTLQQKPPLFVTTSQTWAPIPDEYSHIYNWGFLSLMWLFADDPRFQMANSKFITGLLATSQGLTQTQINIFLQNWQNITGQPQSNQVALTQGAQARGQ